MDNKTEQMLANREGLKEQIQVRDAINRLYKNKDFRKVILDNFLVSDCARNARISVSNMNPEARAKALACAQAAGYLDEYLQANILMGNNAERELLALDADEANSEEVEEL